LKTFSASGKPIKYNATVPSIPFVGSPETPNEDHKTSLETQDYATFALGYVSHSAIGKESVNYIKDAFSFINGL